MGKRKTFVKLETNTKTIEHSRDTTGRVVIPLDVIPPRVTEVRFSIRDNTGSRRPFDMKRWYGVGIDVITYACQRQIERFIETNDGGLTLTTISTYCGNGLPHFLTYCSLAAKAKGRSLELADVNRELIDGYLLHLAGTGVSSESQRCRYKNAKSILVALGRRGILQIVERGDDATFPRNPFPNSNRKSKGEKPMPTAQRKAFAQAVKSALMPLLHEVKEPTSELLAYALLVIALHTGRNTTPLLEMKVDCLRPHPKDNVKLLVLHKRRGATTQRVPVRSDRTIESTPAVWTGIVRIIERVRELTQELRVDAAPDIKSRLWIFRTQRATMSTKQGQVVALNRAALGKAIAKLVANYDLKDSSGNPLRINVSILRQTFANRMFELLDGDVAATAHASGHSPSVAGRHYMKPGEHAEKQWKFMGKAMQEELQSGTLRATEQTPAGRCTDNKKGQFAPKDGAACMNFLNCLRCRNYVVTGDDLHRLFSFYWLIVRERHRVDKRKWKRGYAHIIRMIDRDVIERGIELKVFQPRQVIDARERARVEPHPFWANSNAVEAIQ